jgi:hypothetical protein
MSTEVQATSDPVPHAPASSLSPTSAPAASPIDPPLSQLIATPAAPSLQPDAVVATPIAAAPIAAASAAAAVVSAAPAAASSEAAALNTSLSSQPSAEPPTPPAQLGPQERVWSEEEHSLFLQVTNTKQNFCINSQPPPPVQSIDGVRPPFDCALIAQRLRTRTPAQVQYHAGFGTIYTSLFSGLFQCSLTLLSPPPPLPPVFQSLLCSPCSPQPKASAGEVNHEFFFLIPLDSLYSAVTFIFVQRIFDFRGAWLDLRRSRPSSLRRKCALCCTRRSSVF